MAENVAQEILYLSVFVQGLDLHPAQPTAAFEKTPNVGDIPSGKAGIYLPDA